MKEERRIKLEEKKAIKLNGIKIKKLLQRII
jgi:hypothetical protein